MSCNSSLIVLLALGAVLAAPSLLLYNSLTLCCSLIENTSPQCVRIHFHVLFKASSSISSTLSRIELFCFCCRALPGWQDRAASVMPERWRDVAVCSLPTAQSSLKRPRAPRYFSALVCGQSAGWLGLVHVFYHLMTLVLTVSCLYLSRQN